MNIVIFGAPGSGKGTQSDLMIEKYGFNHISTGDVLRNEIKNGTHNSAPWDNLPNIFNFFAKQRRK